MSRLLSRVQRLEDDKIGKRGPVCIYVDGMTAEEAKERHFAKHPEDREARDFIIVEYRDPTKPLAETKAI